MPFKESNEIYGSIVSTIRGSKDNAQVLKDCLRSSACVFGFAAVEHKDDVVPTE